MLDTNFLIKLYTAFSIYKDRNLSFLVESMGVSEQVISSADYITDCYVSDFERREFPYGIFRYKTRINERDCDFFKDVEIETVYTNSPYDSFGPNARFLEESGFEDNGYHIKMEIFINGELASYKKNLFEVIGHEVAHAYDDYNELKSTGNYSRFRDKLFRDLEKQNRCMFSLDDDEKRFGGLLHMIDDTETQSYQHEIVAEILNKMKNGYVSKDGADYSQIIRDTYIMRTLENNEEYLRNIETSSDEMLRSKVLGIFNDVYGKRYDFGKMVMFIRRKIMNVRKKILQSSAGAFSVAMNLKMDYRNA